MMDQQYTASLASELFSILQTAQQGDLNVDMGFQHKALDGSVTVTYLFYPKDFLVRIPNMPEQFKRGLKGFNVLAGVDRKGQKVGIFLLCATDTPFSAVQSQEDLVSAIHMKGFSDYDAIIREALKADLVSAMDLAKESEEQGK